MTEGGAPGAIGNRLRGYGVRFRRYRVSVLVSGPILQAPYLQRSPSGPGAPTTGGDPGIRRSKSSPDSESEGFDEPADPRDACVIGGLKNGSYDSPCYAQELGLAPE